jgi:hypothetical protein
MPSSFDPLPHTNLVDTGEVPHLVRYAMLGGLVPEKLAV